MFIGILYALAACALWGFVFVIPGLLNDFTSLEVAFGRTAFFGFFCSGLLFFSKRHLITILLKQLWCRAFKLALVANIIHYIFVVLSTRYAHAALTTMLLGIAPITIVLYGNFRTKKNPMIHLLPFYALILFGLILVTFPPIFQLKDIPKQTEKLAAELQSKPRGLPIATSPYLPNTGVVAMVESRELSMRLGGQIFGLFGYTSSTFLYGFIFGILALVTWTWYIVSNALTLQEHPSLNPSDWVTLLGSATLILTLGAIPFYFFICPALLVQRDLVDYFPLLAGSAFLGLGSSWLATYFWNQATRRLPITITGTLSIFETLFGLLYVYLLKGMVAK